MGQHPIHKTTTVALLACAFLLTVRPVPAPAQESAEEAAREMVEGALRKTKKSPADLKAWSRSVIERALKRAGKNATETTTPLPAEDHAGRVIRGLAGRPRGPEVIIFMSLAVPAASWREWSREAARIGAPLVLRGLAPEGLKATVKRVGPYLDAKSGAAIDPRLFRLFDIKVVPAVVVVPGGSRPVRAGAAPLTQHPLTTVLWGTSAWKLRLRRSPLRAGLPVQPLAAISQT